MRRTTVTAAVVASLAMLAACSGAPTQPHHHVRAFTFAEGQRSCNDVAAWFPKAYNSLGPGQQFTPAMARDEALAGNSELGLAL